MTSDFVLKITVAIILMFVGMLLKQEFVMFMGYSGIIVTTIQQVWIAFVGVNKDD